MKRAIGYYTVFLLLALNGHSKDPELLREAQVHLGNINKLSKQGKDFDIEKTYALAQEILKKAEDKALPKELRSRYLNIYAGLVGLYAKAEWDKDEGRNAFYANKKALTIFPCNTSAAMAYAQSLIGVEESFWSHFAKKSLGIGGDQFIREVQSAIQYLEIQERKDYKSRIKKLKRDLEKI